VNNDENIMQLFLIYRVKLWTEEVGQPCNTEYTKIM